MPKLTCRAHARIAPWAVVISLLSAGPEPAVAALGDRPLRTGAEGADVRELQSLLRALGFDQPVTGYFGPVTAAAVRRWERQEDRPSDGEVSVEEADRLRSQARRQSERGEDGERDYRPRPDTDDDDHRHEANGGTDPVAPDPGPPPGRPGRGGSAPGRGPAVPSVPVSSRGYVFPVRGPHSFGTAINRYGAPRGGHSHRGHDILAPTGTPVVAARGGRVTHRAFQGAAGHYVVIAADDGTDHVYMHLQAPAAVQAGDVVRTGQGIGRVGCTGRCSGPHLHFEIWTAHWYRGGRPLDPIGHLRAWDAVS